MEAKAISKFIRISPSKIRQVLSLIRNKNVVEARNILKYSVKRSAVPVLKILNSAVSNLQNKNASIREEDIYVYETFADSGPTIKRFKPRAMGRATLIRKRTSHITIVVSN